MISRTAVIVEDDAMARRALGRGLRTGGFTVHGEAGTAAAGLDLVRAHQPALVFVDVGLGDERDGIALVEDIRIVSDAGVVLVTAHWDPRTLERARVGGAIGIVIKPFHQGQLIASAELALTLAAHRPEKDTRYLEQIAGILAQAGVLPDRSAAVDARASFESRPEFASLTGREVEVVQAFMVHGRVDKVARALSISAHTVRNHLKAVYSKLGVKSQAELVARFHTRQLAG